MSRTATVSPAAISAARARNAELTAARGRLSEIDSKAEAAIKLAGAAGGSRAAALAGEATTRRDWLDVVEPRWNGQHPEATASKAVAACQEMASLADERRRLQAKVAELSE